MQGEVSLRFIQSLEYLKSTKKIPSIRQFSITIGIHPQCISDVVRGKREVNCDILSKTIKHFNVNPIFLYTGKGSVLLNNNSEHVSADPILTIVTDEKGEEKIIHVPVAAQAGYSNNIHNAIFIQDLPTFSLPDSRYNAGTHRCFDIAGDSMEPTVYSGDKVVCSFIEPDNWFNGIRANYVYVIISREGVVIKRVINNLKSNGTLSLISDNNFYAPYEIELKDIVEVWQVSVKISPFMPSPGHIRNGLHNEVDLLKTTITDQSEMIKSLNSTVEKLLKINRTSTVR
ncbi:MAG: S24 family peptidase [Saprospiraceae bacterium]|nr:S24 family peptidase [Bacteroidia bacterium]NNE13973.1 S24 family peptidase [Saprospiraceae bacterium]NNL92767.1 S24 family peptidase [Saprospiraceae bacterium]